MYISLLGPKINTRMHLNYLLCKSHGRLPHCLMGWIPGKLDALAYLVTMKVRKALGVLFPPQELPPSRTLENLNTSSVVVVSFQLANVSID